MEEFENSAQPDMKQPASEQPQAPLHEPQIRRYVGQEAPLEHFRKQVTDALSRLQKISFVENRGCRKNASIRH